MLDDAVTRLLDAGDPVKAFGQLVKPGETVGIKTNVWSYLPTPRELEAAIKKRVIDAGVAEDRIGLDDHTVRTNPLFVNATSGHFNLLPGSPCIGAGTNVSLTSDYVGVVVPWGAAQDIGAYEYYGPGIYTGMDMGMNMGMQ